MGRKISLLLAALLLLGGCYAAQPLEDPSPSAAETSTPTSTSEPTQEVKELWGFPIDDTHDAFEVDTKGKLGTVLVTVERGEENEKYGFPLTLSVWTEGDLTTPIQTISGYISYSAAGDGEETFHRWEDGRLVCFRKEERTYPDGEGKQEKVIYERVNGQLTEVSREPLVMLG